MICEKCGGKMWLFADLIFNDVMLNKHGFIDPDCNYLDINRPDWIKHKYHRCPECEHIVDVPEENK